MGRLAIKCLAIKHNKKYKDDCVLGRSVNRKYRFSDDEKVILQNQQLDVTVPIFSRAVVNRITFTSKAYKETKTNCYTVEVRTVSIEEDTGIVQIKQFFGTINFFFVLDNEICFIAKELEIDLSQTFTFSQNGLDIPVPHIFPVKENGGGLIFVKSSEITNISSLIRVGNYVCKEPHRIKNVIM